MKARKLNRPVEILQVEDNLGDVHMTRMELEALPVPVNVHVAETVDEALAFLRPSTTSQSKPRPDLILLDLKLPGRDGHELLREAAADDRLRPIPIVVVSGSSATRDVELAYALSASGYISKGAEPEDLRRGLRALAGFFLGEGELPSRNAPGWP